MKEAKTDHEIDVEFGQWLRDQRSRCGLTLEQAAQRSGVAVERLKSLELGYAEKGITQHEADKIRTIYKLDLKEFLDRAAGKS
ncbi:MAG: helix-turn-helix domain-containing protein [Deltaproteobacteria bacterium]|nr:helix-turn-helix domain-containing protein [Deltaproteobacteria bacterium]